MTLNEPFGKNRYTVCFILRIHDEIFRHKSVENKIPKRIFLTVFCILLFLIIYYSTSGVARRGGG